MLKIFCFVASRLQRDEKGASAVEYAILVGAVGAAVVAAVAGYSGKLTTLFSNIISTAQTPAG
jgi:pilus assembly protein Flp/PilA